MNRTMQSSILSVMGAVTLTACWTGIYTTFVKPALAPFLVASGLVLLAMGIYGVVTARGADEVHDPMTAPGELAADGHDHSAGPRVGWLLLVPFLILGFVVPPPLGSYAAGRGSGELRPDAAQVDISEDLVAGQVTEMTLAEYGTRALYDDTGSLEGQQVRLTGFVAGADEAASGGEGAADWTLARMTLSCCAADAYPIKVQPTGVDQPHPHDTWVAVTGTWDQSPEPGDDGQYVLPRLAVQSVEVVAQPEIPYE